MGNVMERETFVYQIGRNALRAILYEVAVTPKPGLVDQNNSGAHSDMDFYTFIDSASALHGVFDRFTQIGGETGTSTYRQARTALQIYGLEAERKMFALTGGVNTHKGIIFSLGFLCGAIGRIGSSGKLTPENITAEVKKLCSGLCQEVYSDELKHKKDLTKGEKVYLRYGFKGARAEAEQGFPTVLKVALPEFLRRLDEGIDINRTSVYTLLKLIAHTADTNILSRHDMDTAMMAKKEARETVRKLAGLNGDDLSAVRELDRLFIEKNISPGGCADLLAVTIFLYFICYEAEIDYK